MSTKDFSKKQYSQEFKAQVLEIAENSPKSLMAISKEFGVSYPTLLNWTKANSLKKPENFEKEETKKLKSELERLRKENEILKKAATFFAKQLD